MKLKSSVGRPRKVLRNLVLTLLITAALLTVAYPYIAIPRLKMLLEERNHLVGPSAVIDKLSSQEYDEFQHTYVGKTKDGFVFYGVKNPNYTIFSYREKTGSLTLLCAPTTTFAWEEQTVSKRLPVYLFDEYPDAARAELELTIASNTDDARYPGNAFDVRFTSEAVREQDGYFRFFLTADTDGHPLGDRGEALEFFSDVCHTSSEYYINQQVLGAVRLFDRSGNLIAAETLIVRTKSGAAHVDQKG